MKNIYIIGAMACLLSACKPSVNITTPPSAGDVDFTNYMAIGNSLTAGYADNSLTVSGQLNSYPQRLFEQFSLVGAKGPFIQPLLVSDIGYPGPKKVMGYTYGYCTHDTSMGPVDYPTWVSEPRDAETYLSGVNNNQINNVAVPGIRVVDYPVAGYASAFNPYAKRFYKDPSKRPLDELQYRVSNLSPTFFTMWMGANDVLGYATAGGQGDGTGNASPSIPGFNLYNNNDISPIKAFTDNYDSILRVARSSGADGALINIPDVTSIPFFTTVPANGLTLTRQGQVDSLQALYARAGFDKVFQLGANYFIVQDHNGNTRQAVPGELILLTVPQDSIKCKGWGSIKPIPAQYVLTTDELQNIRNNTKLMNEIIKARSVREHLAYVDMNTYLGTISKGITYNGIKYTAEYVTGGAFSLDGVHLTPRGYALVANEILRTINEFYHATIPYTDVNKYPGIKF